uniref:DUF4218 domain-containing protein n=1 Tax=Ascaris lumbricoides TaxID=6252 RepID=A0A0M3I8Q6_ASCLU
MIFAVALGKGIPPFELNYFGCTLVVGWCTSNNIPTAADDCVWRFVCHWLNVRMYDGLAALRNKFVGTRLSTLDEAVQCSRWLPNDAKTLRHELP